MAVAPARAAAGDLHSYRTLNCFPLVADPAPGVRNAAGLLEMTPMAKFQEGGPDAGAWHGGLLSKRSSLALWPAEFS